MTNDDDDGWVIRPVKTVGRRPYNLYCVGGDVKPCSINQSTRYITARSYGATSDYCFVDFEHFPLWILLRLWHSHRTYVTIEPVY